MSINDLRNPSCRACGLRRDCKTICNMGVDDLISVEPELGAMMVISDYPALEDDANGTVGQSSKEELFWSVAKEVVRVNTDYIYFTYVNKCMPRESHKVTDDELFACASTYLRKEIKRVRPKVILLMGAHAMKALGFKGIVGKMRGQTHTLTFKFNGEPFETKVVITQSPVYVKYNTSELKNFASDINKAWGISNGSEVMRDSPTKVTLITNLQEVEELIGYIHETKECAFDFETTTLTDRGIFDPNFKATLMAVSFQHGSAYTIPLFHFDTPFTEKQVLHILKRFSEEVWMNKSIRKINQNIKFDMHVAARYGFPVFRGRLDCTMVMHTLYDDLTRHGIKEWIPTFFPQFTGWELEIKGKEWEKIPLKQLSDYAGVDTDAALRGCTVLEQKLLEDPRSYRIYRNLSVFALTTLYNMERRGMLIGRGEITKYAARAVDLLKQQVDIMNKYPQVKHFVSEEAELAKQKVLVELREKKSRAKGKQIDKYAVKIREVKSGAISVYKGINFGSTQQLGELLYTDAGFNFREPYDKKKKKAGKVTGEAVLKNLGDKTGFITDVLVYRSIKTTWSRYLKGLGLLMDEHDKVHTTFKQAAARTGRLACVGVDTLIHTNIGHVRIGDLIPECEGIDECMLGIEALTHTGEFKPITHVINKGEEEMYRVEMHSGQIIDCTMQHIFYTDIGWKSLKDILNSQTECRIFYELTDLSDPEV